MTTPVERDFNECECPPKYVRGHAVHSPECDEEYEQYQAYVRRKQAFHDAVARGEIPEIIK